MPLTCTMNKNVFLAGGTFKVWVPAAHRVNGVVSYTYRIEVVNTNRIKRFVRFLPGTAPVYLGELDDFTGQVRLTNASKLPASAHELKLLNRMLARIWGGEYDVVTSAGFAVDFTESPYLAAEENNEEGAYGDPNAEQDEMDGERAFELHRRGDWEGMNYEERIMAAEYNNVPPPPPPAAVPAPAKQRSAAEEMLRRLLPTGNEPWARR